MVDSALSGGSAKTSAISFCVDSFAPRFAQVCSGCPRSECIRNTQLETQPTAPSKVEKAFNGAPTGMPASSYCFDCFIPRVVEVCGGRPRPENISRPPSPKVPFQWTEQMQMIHEFNQSSKQSVPAAPIPAELPNSMSIAAKNEELRRQQFEIWAATYSPKLTQSSSVVLPKEEETFDEFLLELLGEELRTPLEVFDSVEGSIEEASDDEEEIVNDKGAGRKSAEDGKNTAFNTPFMEALESISQPCNHLCPLSGFCTRRISTICVLDLRRKYFLESGQPAPKDKQRATLIMQYLQRARKDKENHLIFTVDNQEVCTPAFLRLLGVSTSADYTKSPGQWQRLIKGFLASENSEFLLSEEDLKADAQAEYTEKRGHATAFINDIANYFSDTIPAVTTEDGETKTMVVPYRHRTDLYREYVFHCEALGIGKDKRASYPTFCRAWAPLYDAKVVKFLGGKSGFQTCAICNNTLSIKQTACCKRDTITRDALLKVHSLHLSQQACERQFADNFSLESEKVEDGQPLQAHIDFDGQSTWVGNTPKWSKDRSSAPDSVIENRNIGVRIVCGPVKEYISVCTNNLIPHGANVLVEVLKYSIEYLAERLAEFGMVLPKKLGVQGDNSEENKVMNYHI
jgi:hypothetical protein